MFVSHVEDLEDLELELMEMSEVPHNSQQVMNCLKLPYNFL